VISGESAKGIPEHDETVIMPGSRTKPAFRMDDRHGGESPEGGMRGPGCMGWPQTGQRWAGATDSVAAD